MKVADLTAKLDQKESTPVVALGQVELRDEGLILPNVDEPIPFDEQAQLHLGKHLGIPPRYLGKIPRALQQANVNHFLQSRGETEAMFHLSDYSLNAVHDPSKRIIPMTRLIESVSNACSPDDTVQEFRYELTKCHVDILSEQSITVPGLGTEHRPLNDITQGGIRFRTNADFEIEKPSLESFLLRLVCTNGLAIPEPEYKIKLRGNTVDEILESMEENAQRVLEGLPERLQAYRDSAEVTVPGNVDQFMYQIGRERGLGARIMDRVMEEATSLPENPSVYEVLNVFTYVATQDVSYMNRLRLQGLGGDLVVDTQNMLHRCNSCERPLGVGR